MNQDLSLSSALGGLRIANPDEDAVISPTTSPFEQSSTARPPPPPSSHSSGDTITDTQHPALLPVLAHASGGQEGGGIGFNPDSYTLQNGGDSPASSHDSRSPTTPHTDAIPRARRIGNRQSVPVNHQAQQQAQYPTHSANFNQQFRNPSAPQNVATRPISGMYQQHNASSSSQGSHRYRDELGSSHSNVSGLERSGSSSARGMLGGMGGAIPQRQSSQSYRPSTGQPNGGNGPLPPRRNSRRTRAPTNGSTEFDTPVSASAPLPNTAEDWRERGAAMSTRQEVDSSGQVQTRLVKKGVKDFNFGRTLGEGSYSTVLAATDRQNLKEYAIKVLDKRHIIKEKKVKYVNIERDTLNRLTEHPGVVRLYYTSQDERSLYFVLDLASGGELLGVLKKMGTFDVECTQFYGAQILDSVAYMHSRGVIHRDLKPENVLLDRSMHTKITDFGTAKILPDPKAHGAGNNITPGSPIDGAEEDRANSFVGTAEYVSPELLNRSNACKASDLWAFGCIIYQLLAGRPPFKAANEYLTFQKILNLEYSFPDGFPAAARDLVERLLVLEPANRLPVDHIMSHEFFDGVQWGKELWRQKPPRLKSYVPPTPGPIKLNVMGDSKGGPAPHQNQVSTSQPHTSSQRPQLGRVTDLPPPSQLDIDWSPVLTHNNERILKLGNLIVCVGPQEKSPSGKNGEPGTPSDRPKFKSFFTGNQNKRRERLVLITSSARLIIAAAGGNEKKAKMEVNCLTNGTTWKNFMDAKGLTAFQLDTREKHLTFEDPRATTSDPAGSKYSTQEWLDALDNARDIAMATALSNSYSGDSFLNPADSSISSPSDSLGGDAAMPMSGPSVDRHHMRNTLRKNTDESFDSSKTRKRFSKRHSKSGLAAVF
ncbi:serine/threonine protein kinase [Vermiconidia calcicola]|uniref:Serine/threonine protein kinase n=1 Tax=Vermiconidia calcicola TaxID=1690605 RepID=A0ACC3NRF5_9PEZI|nr:serine/threonine protein kinase [Vermiconidia calcicola]